jgi:hypothetical protein
MRLAFIYTPLFEAESGLQLLRLGNDASVSLPAAWAARRPAPHGPVAWTAVGAGLTWGAALTGVEWE